MFNKFLYTVLFIVASSCALLAQEGVIVVLDSETKEPLEFVHLIFKDKVTNKQSVTTTDFYGKAKNMAINPSTLRVSFVGFSTIYAEVEPGKSYTYRLETGSEGLEEVVVTGQYAPVSESNSVYKVKVLGSTFIESRGAVTLNQLLNDQLNIRISQDNATGSGMTMQGLGDNNVKILLDGVPVSGRLNGNIDLSQINLDNIERIEIIEGPMSVIYGSNSLGGTINLISKKPQENQQNAGANFFYESVGAYNVDGWANFGSKNNATKINIGRNFFTGWSPTEVVRDEQWNQKEQYFGSAALNHNFKNLDIGFSVDGLWEQIKDKGDRRSEFSNYAFDNWYTTNRWMNTLTADIKNIPKHNFKIIGSYTFYNRTKLRYNRDLVNLSQELTTNPTDHDTTVINTALTRAVLGSNFEGRWNYQVGADLNWENTSGGRIVGKPEMGDYALFASGNWQASRALVIQPALRFAYNTQFTAPVVPSINFQYKVGHESQLRLSLAQGFRAPSLKELYLDFVDINHNITGNPDLQPENSNHIHLYYSWRTNVSEAKLLKIEPSLFYNHINNMIRLTQVQGTEYTYLNIDQYTTFGGKIEFGYNVHPNFDFKLGYSHLAYSNQLEAEGDQSEFLYSPEFVATFNYWRAQKKFRFNVNYKYTGAVPGFRVGDDGEPVQTKIPAYNMMDITASYAFWKNRFTISGGGKNLFDVKNLDVLNGGGGVHASGDFVVSWGISYFLSLKFSWI